jgi:hypothetical protein
MIFLNNGCRSVLLSLAVGRDIINELLQILHMFNGYIQQNDDHRCSSKRHRLGTCTEFGDDMYGKVGLLQLLLWLLLWLLLQDKLQCVVRESLTVVAVCRLTICENKRLWRDL